MWVLPSNEQGDQFLCTINKGGVVIHMVGDDDHIATITANAHVYSEEGRLFLIPMSRLDLFLHDKRKVFGEINLNDAVSGEIRICLYPLNVFSLLTSDVCMSNKGWPQIIQLINQRPKGTCVTL